MNEGTYTREEGDKEANQQRETYTESERETYTETTRETYTEVQEKQGKRGREGGRETYTREEGDKEANQQQEERGTAYGGDAFRGER